MPHFQLYLSFHSKILANHELDMINPLEVILQMIIMTPVLFLFKKQSSMFRGAPRALECHCASGVPVVSYNYGCS